MLVDDALLLIGHGSARYADAGRAMQLHADTLRKEGRFAQVECGLLNGSPTVNEALSRIVTATIRVVPFFMEDGYFARIGIPRALQSATPASTRLVGPRMLLCPPIGTHDRMAAIIARLALAACADLDAPASDVAVMVVGHGSSSAPGRALALHRHASRVAETRSFGRVEPACLEEAPLVADTLAALRGYPVAAIGFFANRGGHVRDDVPNLVAAEQAVRGGSGHAVRFHGSVADDAAMPQIIVDQAMQDPRGE